MVPVATILLALAIAPGLAVGSSPAASAATDVHGLAAAAVNLTAVKAASTLSVITYLVDDLTTSRGQYRNMLQSLAGVLVDLGAGRFESAWLELSAHATSGPDGCDIMLFEGNAHKDPISQENSENDLLVRLATDITDLLKRKPQTN
nr:unnamed protein product [Digitaria exilis]